MAQVHLPVLLRPLAGGNRVVAATGRTVRDVILDLDRRHPGFADRVLDGQTGELHRFINVYANDEDVRYHQGLETPVAENDVINILPAVAGGDGRLRPRAVWRSGRAQPAWWRLRGR